MEFYKDQIFHIYNQGNNKQTVFFSDENYKYFLWKMRAYLLPFGDLISYCLMPNHFHWQFYVRQIEMQRRQLREQVDAVEFRRRKLLYGNKAKPVEYKSERMAKEDSLISLNHSIGILQRVYARALNKSMGRSGSIFRVECKARDGWTNEVITEKDYRFMPGNDYSYKCFNYLHENPVKANLVKKATDYKFSSARDYAGLRNGTICNLEFGKEIIDFI